MKTTKELSKLNELLTTYGISFSEELINEVKRSYVLREYPEEFVGLNDQQLPLVFFRVSNSKQSHIGLADKIGSIVINKITDKQYN